MCVYVCVCVCVCVCNNIHPEWVKQASYVYSWAKFFKDLVSECDSKPHLNLEFSFPNTDYYSKIKAPSLSYFLFISGGRLVKCETFLKNISAL